MATWSKPVLFQGYKFQALISGPPFSKPTVKSHICEFVCLGSAPEEIYASFRRKFINMKYLDWLNYENKNSVRPEPFDVAQDRPVEVRTQQHKVK